MTVEQGQRASGRPPARVLLAGCARSGTSWTARVLGTSADSRLIAEPDNINSAQADPGPRASADTFRPFPVLQPGESAPHYQALWRMAFAGRVPGRSGVLHPMARLVLAMPAPLRNAAMRTASSALASAPGQASTVIGRTIFAQFALEWLDDVFSPAIVVVQRAPLNVVSSWLEWNLHGFDLERRQEVRAACARMGVELPATPESAVGMTAWWIGLLAQVQAKLVERNPGWILVTHEDLCAEPEAQFRDLFGRLGLTWTAETDHVLSDTRYLTPAGRTDHGRGPAEGTASAVRAQAPVRWRERLSPAQIAEAEAVLATFPSAGWVARPAMSAG